MKEDLKRLKNTKIEPPAQSNFADISTTIIGNF